MKKLFVSFLFLFFIPSAQAKFEKTDWTMSSGSLTYHGNFTLKKFNGTSTGAKGKGKCDASTCHFVVAVPIKSFDSGDGNRDSNMLEVTKATTYPMVGVEVDFQQPADNSLLDSKVTISFGGKTHTYEHFKIKTASVDNGVKVSGTIPLVLTDYAIERPSLLGVKIDDSVPVDFEILWN